MCRRLNLEVETITCVSVGNVWRPHASALNWVARTKNVKRPLPQWLPIRD